MLYTLGMSREAYIDVNGAAGDKDFFPTLVQLLVDRGVSVYFFTDSPKADAMADLRKNGVDFVDETVVLTARDLAKRTGIKDSALKPIPVEGDILVIESDRSTGPEGKVYGRVYPEFVRSLNPQAEVIMIPEAYMPAADARAVEVRVEKWLDKSTEVSLGSGVVGV